MRYIAFTGSRDVGLDIHSRAAQPQKGQIWIKRTVLEMGGKDTIVVDADADLDSAVQGVAAAAFGFQGQKCSACSRAIVHQDIYDAFLEKLKADRGKDRHRPARRQRAHGPGDQRRRHEIDSQLHRDRQAGRPPDHGRRARPGRRLFHPAHRDRRYRPDGAPLAGRDLRTGAGRDQGEGFRRRPGDRQQHRVRTHRRGLHHQRRQDRAHQARVPRRQLIYQSQVHRRGSRRQSRSAASICPARIPRPAARITCTCSARPNRSARSCKDQAYWPVTGLALTRSTVSRRHPLAASRP